MKKLLILMILFPLVCFGQTRPHVSQIRAVETIAELKTMVPSVNGTWAYVQGYYSRGDGGGGDFYWSSSSTASQNGGTIITPTGHTSAGRWMRQHQPNGELRVEWFGALPNSGECEADRIQAAINTAKGEAVVRLPLGTFLLGKTLENHPRTGGNFSPLMLYGTSNGKVDTAGALFRSTDLVALEGIPTRVIKTDSGTPQGLSLDAKVILDLTPGAPEGSRPRVAGTDIKNIRFTQSSDVTGDVVGIHTLDWRLCLLENCYFRGLRVGFNVKGYGYYSVVRNCGFNYNTVGMAAWGNWNSSAIRNCVFSNGEVGIRGSYLDTGFTIDGCYFENQSGTAIRSAYSRRLVTHNSYFENNLGSLVYFRGREIAGDTGSICVFRDNYVKVASGTPHLILARSSDLIGGEVPEEMGVVVHFSGNYIENTKTMPVFRLINSHASNGSFKQATLVANQYRYPNGINFTYLGSTLVGNRINRLFDGAGATTVFARQWSPATSTPDINGAQEGFVPGMLRFNLGGNNKFQGVASTTVGWEDLH